MRDEGLAVAKVAARAAALARRAGSCGDRGERLAAHVLADCAPPAGAVVSGFWPIGDEIDVRPLMVALSALGHRLCLPETPKRGLPLVFRHWMPGEALVAGRFGTSHPVGEVVVPDFVLVPLLAFDRKGNRLGYGAGYYDRTLAAMPGAFRLGCAFACQEVAAVPVGPHDERLDAVATEIGVIGMMR
ncbi:5-formyltetrahydrofolate cyclo-ligase [Acidiphilium acidophilum]|uniref:5-formyltetrahydrofolate cyclo-ligase n=1 Tax=Acidiphilium acidophilum TaxID=76588 RepID=A0AAW9DU46_ACIAO|nr:5-formyltetrahydrofolate cyclo-ligase [Acidiphilium acidophilum]MDX5932744.1 5-formyltetrahydrofolate cyclo-ligase [Acidiphilium acidophilum]